MSAYFKKFALGFGKALLALAVALAALTGYAVYAEQAAADKAADFCRSIAPGDATSDLADRAMAVGASERHSKWSRGADGSSQIPVTFSGATPFSRHVCMVMAQGDRVISSQVVHLD